MGAHVAPRRMRSTSHIGRHAPRGPFGDDTPSSDDTDMRLGAMGYTRITFGMFSAALNREHPG